MSGGAKPASTTRSISAARRPVKAAPSGERARRARPGGRGVGRRRRGREDVRAGPVDHEVDDVAGCRDEAARASPKSWTWCRPARPFPPDADPVPASHPTASVPPGAEGGGGRGRRGPHRGRGGRRGADKGDELVEGGGVPIHGEHGVGDDDGRASRPRRAGARRPAVRQQSRDDACPGGGRRRAPTGQPAAIDDAGVVQLVRDDRTSGPRA